MVPTSPARVSARAYGAAAGLRNLFMAAALVACAATAAAAEVRILAFGDSLTQGYGLPEEEGFVPRLQAWLRENGAADSVVINGGVSGDTTAGGARRIEWALSDEVDAVIVALGGNDMLRGVEPSVTRDNLEAILTDITERGLPAILAGLPAPANYGPEYQQAFEAIFPELAAQYDVVLYPSFLTGLSETGDPEEARSLMQPDGIHPNAEGVQAIVADIGPVVLDLVETAD